VALVVGLALAGVFVWGGYLAGWRWTGLSRKVTLWDWLEGLALPVTVALVPLFLRHRQRLRSPHKLTAATVLVAFTGLVLAGYLVPWAWTGFTDNTLWDWLSLVLLPVMIAVSTLWEDPVGWVRAHRLPVTAAALAAGAVVLAGYLVPWAWTGFTGNTAWDWLKLLLLPVLVPTLVQPRLMDAATEWVTGGHETAPSRR
jgi:hypothetical protein